MRVWPTALFKTEEKATKKQKVRSNKDAGSIPMIENEEYGTKMIRQCVRSFRNS